jgi:uncharacterized protein HemX
LAKPHDDLGVSLRGVQACTTTSATQTTGALRLCAGLVFALAWALAGHAMAQPAPLTSAEQEQRRAEERDRLLREQQERAPDVRLPSAPAAEAEIPHGQKLF